jgi:hypothetical protein
MPISSAASRSLAVVGMMPWLPTPTGMWSNSDCSSQSNKQASSREWWHSLTDVKQDLINILAAWPVICRAHGTKAADRSIGKQPRVLYDAVVTLIVD